MNGGAPSFSSGRDLLIRLVDIILFFLFFFFGQPDPNRIIMG